MHKHIDIEASTKLSPPRFGGRMNFGRYNVFFCLFFKAFLAFFFFASQKCSWCGLGTPTHFDLRDFGAGGGREYVSVPPPPHNPLRICAPDS